MTSESNQTGTAFAAAARMKAARRTRMCTSKRRYETEALALDAAVRRMAAVSEVPLYTYACPYCVGFHLTAENQDGTKVCPVLLHAGSGRIFMPHEAPAPASATAPESSSIDARLPSPAASVRRPGKPTWPASRSPTSLTLAKWPTSSLPTSATPPEPAGEQTAPKPVYTRRGRRPHRATNHRATSTRSGEAPLMSATAHALVGTRVEIPIGHNRRKHGDQYGKVDSAINGGKIAVRLEKSGKVITLRPADVKPAPRAA
jgi:hypothetical protein